ncbi:hypothetical protein [Tenacibaculum ovolyticum]|uniref:hypothetical protein n=1 Tax=Tenacibaculum ovolyticum TaxID=104270 RepID=UPI0004047EE0|nr:hypothetical protein [Tenacibaculum ovolyticum]
MLKRIKACFCITNISVAKYCKVSYEMIGSISAERRTYNAKILNRLEPLYKVLNFKKPITELPIVVSFKEKELQNTVPRVAQLLNKTKKILAVKETNLKLLEKNRIGWLRGLHACSELLEKEDLMTNDTKWVHLRKSHLKIQLADNSLFKIVQLQGEIVGLKAKVDSLQASIK